MNLKKHRKRMEEQYKKYKNNWGFPVIRLSNDEEVEEPKIIISDKKW